MMIIIVLLAIFLISEKQPLSSLYIPQEGYFLTDIFEKRFS